MVESFLQEDHFGQHKYPEPGAMSVRFFRDFYRFDSSHVRTHDFEKNEQVMATYEASNHSVGLWDIYDAGWHCSWCFSPEGIRKKLLDAPKSDYPRYGDDLAKTTVEYIKRLIKHGKIRYSIEKGTFFVET
jgi:beta-1,4-mannosyl-glycoprotein beta-1,4-N-acetylglucosaminyltransferase